MNPKIARNLKKIFVYPRYYRSLFIGRKNFKKYKNKYKQNILFVAGLPKSGTTWLENMLASYPGITPIMPYQVTKHEMKYKSSIEYDLPKGVFEPLKNGLYVMKMHIYGSNHNVNILKKNNIKYCIIYRDLRDAAVSHCFYVRST
ncbi:MAG: sulfotransferase domain-containing protein, partial [Candidatus Helarchaeota archaeon]